MSDSSHWTEWGTADFRYSITLDFLDLIEAHRVARGLNETELAGILGVSLKTLRDTFHGDRTQTLLEMIEWARALGLKLSILAYDDGDPKNRRGPIFAQVFLECWERAGKPKDFWDLESD